MLLRKYQEGDKFQKLKLPNIKGISKDATVVMNGPVEKARQEEESFKNQKAGAKQQAYKQLQRGTLTSKRYNEIIKDLDSVKNSTDAKTDVLKRIKKSNGSIEIATKTPVITNTSRYKDKEKEKEFFEKATDTDRSYLEQDILPNLARAGLSLATQGDLSMVPKNYELYKRNNIGMSMPGRWGDETLRDAGGINTVESFNPFRSVRDAGYNIQDENYGQAGLNIIDALPLAGLYKPLTKGLVKAGQFLKANPLINTAGIRNLRLLNNANAVNTGLALTGAGLELTGKVLKFKPTPTIINTVDAIKQANQPFQSEINWSKWNKEIPENKALIDEYHAIEQFTKANDTWMKNSDGSKFKGAPEQFVQQNSENFKKAFPEGYDKTYRGDPNHFTEFKKDRGIYTGENFFNASHYTAANNPGFWNPEKHFAGQNLKFTMPESTEEINKLVREAFKTGDYSKVDQYRYNKILNSDSGGLRELYSPKSKNNLEIDAEKNEWTSIPFKGKKASTDEIAQELFDKNLDYINIKNVNDPNLDNLKIINPIRINIKSARNNNGMFDMTNPNIYKVLAPIGIGSLLYNKNK
jgi:hypothetical protein